MSLHATPNQTVGPYFAIGLAPLYRDDLAPAGVEGARVHISGRVLDGDGAPVGDALLELWQADAAGRYAHPADDRGASTDPRFTGFGRVATDPDGRFGFTTIRPGAIPGPAGRMQAPHLAVGVFMRGLLRHLVTRIYFDGEPANADDPILTLVPDARRDTLVARTIRPGEFAWDVILQGDRETVFFDC